MFNFDSDKAGKLAAGFTKGVGNWKVVADKTAPSKPNVLAQTAKNGRRMYNVTLAAKTNLLDVDITVSIKAVSGECDQGGGLVWRAADAHNYYVCRWNPLEDNYRFYKVVKGKRSMIATANLNAKPGWHEVRAVMKGNKVTCYFDGKKYLEATDDTFKGPGKVGLWSKADAVSHFDDLTVSGK
ncbi:MAG: hypothetical protein J7M21_02815 [Planctomycetes bacterium]|nr:hypothetical protein [Planctomycetota bacterium]